MAPLPTTMTEQPKMPREDRASIRLMGRLLGNRALASLILNGHRQLSKAHIRKLANHFKISAALFLDVA